MLSIVGSLVKSEQFSYKVPFVWAEFGTFKPAIKLPVIVAVFTTDQTTLFSAFYRAQFGTDSSTEWCSQQSTERYAVSGAVKLPLELSIIVAITSSDKDPDSPAHSSALAGAERISHE